ncbi:hypothetical protein NUV26_18475, partial [Burkholderia pseudomultivorans]|nr:hypothetical protein [Burkholderia pseudomultivorans]
AAEDKLDRAGEKALHARAARLERAADEVADGYAVRRFATAGGWAGDAGVDAAAHAAGHAGAQPEATAAFDAQMGAHPAGAETGATADGPRPATPPDASERRC